MPTFAAQQYATYFKRLLQFGHSGNNGTPTIMASIQAGDGVPTAISLSDDVLQVKPQNDDSVGAFTTKSSGGSNILAVDTTNSKVLAGASQVSVNTFYQTFSANKLVPVAGEHMVLSAVPTAHFGTALAEISLGDGTDPATTYDMSTGNLAVNLPNSIFRLPHNVTLDSASVLFAVSSADDETINFHIMSYAIDTDNGGTSGDLSSGVVVADSSTQTTDRTSIDYLALTIQSADVDAGRVLIGTIESTSTEEVSANMTLTYHIR